MGLMIWDLGLEIGNQNWPLKLGSGIGIGECGLGLDIRIGDMGTEN